MAEKKSIEQQSSDQNAIVHLHQLELHPGIIGAVNLEAFEWLFTNQLSPDVLLDHIELSPIPVIHKKGGRNNQRYLVIGSIIEYLWLSELTLSRSVPDIPIIVKESFDLRKSLGSIAFGTWAKRSGPGPNAVSAALFKDQERLRMESRLPTMTSDYLSSVGGGNISRLKLFTGFDNRALERSKAFTGMTCSMQKYVALMLELDVEVHEEESEDLSSAE